MTVEVLMTCFKENFWCEKNLLQYFEAVGLILRTKSTGTKLCETVKWNNFQFHCTLLIMAFFLLVTLILYSYHYILGQSYNYVSHLMQIDTNLYHKPLHTSSMLSTENSIICIVELILLVLFYMLNSHLIKGKL